MNQLKHTPGEWKADIEDDGLQLILITAGDEVIAEVHGDPRPVSDTEDCTEEGIANGKLIAAAPDLLDALITVRNWISLSPITRGLSTREQLAEAFDLARTINAAIAKATGQ